MKLSTSTADLGYFSDSIAEQLPLFKETGFKTFDLSLYRINYPGSPYLASNDLWKHEIEAAGEKAAELGFSFCQSHSPAGIYFGSEEERESLILSTRCSIEACGMLGIKDLVVHNHASPDLTPTRFMQENKKFNQLFFADMEKHGVNILVENGTRKHSAYFYLYDGAMIREYIEYVDHPQLFACWDTGHAHMDNQEGDYQYKSILDLGDLLRGVHIADNKGEKDDHTAPYFGTCNFAPVIQGLLDIDFQGTFNFETNRILFNHDSWPYPRKPWSYQGKVDTRLDTVPLAIRQSSVALLYQIGKFMLEKYNCFEE